MGRLMATQLFEDDVAEVGPIVTAVNERMAANGAPAFSRAEAILALEKLDEANDVMFPDGELVFKI